MIHQCKNCFNSFKRPKTKAKFCSRSCSVSFNNKKNPKRGLLKKRGHLKINYCNCGTIIKNCSQSCVKCYTEHRSIDKVTLGEVIYHNQQESNRYARIRSHARSKFKHITKCQQCGYSKHIERCHIKAINSFPFTAKLSEINHKSNLLFLCPNCHWEYDNL